MEKIQKITLKQQLLIFALSLALIRILKFENIGPLFLVWNLFLAYVPLLLIQQIKLYESKYWNYFILFLSILFLPNSIYIFTDLFHLKKNLHAPLWFDLILILSFGILGFYYFSKTMQEILRFMKTISLSHSTIKVLKIALIFLCSFGVYLGRYLRLNSWDLFSNPFQIVFKLNEAIAVGKLSEILQITLFFGLFIYFIYELFEKAEI